jgi:hypothetical protein
MPLRSTPTRVPKSTCELRRDARTERGIRVYEHAGTQTGFASLLRIAPDRRSGSSSSPISTRRRFAESPRWSPPRRSTCPRPLHHPGLTCGDAGRSGTARWHVSEPRYRRRGRARRPRGADPGWRAAVDRQPHCADAVHRACRSRRSRSRVRPAAGRATGPGVPPLWSLGVRALTVATKPRRSRPKMVSSRGHSHRVTATGSQPQGLSHKVTES